MFPLVLALIAGLSWGSADFAGGIMTKRLAPATVLVVGQSVGLVFIAGLVVALGEPMPEARDLLIGGLGGLAGAVGLASLYKGLAVGRMSIVAPTAALSGAVPVVAGFLQGERPASLQLVGMVVAGVGIVLAVRATEPDHAATAVGPDLAVAPSGADRGRPRRPTAGIGYALSAALFLGLLVTSLDVAGENGPLWATLMVRVVSVPLFALAWFVRGAGLPSRGDAAVLAGVGLLDNGANVLFAIAAREGLLTLVSVLGSLYPVSTVLLARFFLHERLGRVQAFGVAAAFAGVGLIAAG